jgi:hypothetical protein
MNLRDILSIAGKSGLYKLSAQSNNRIIVESLENGKKMPVQATNKVSALEDISIYTYEDDLPLGEVFQKIKAKENGGKAIHHKSSGSELRNYMEEVLPDYDEERVYDSDLKKLFQWYNILQENGLLEEEEKEEQKEEEQKAENKATEEDKSE